MRIHVVSCFLLLSGCVACGQTDIIAEHAVVPQQQAVHLSRLFAEPREPQKAATVGQVPPEEQARREDEASKLPSMPRPRLADQNKPTCPRGAGRSCFMEGGQSDFEAPFHMDEPDTSWPRAMSHPIMWTTSGLLVGLTAKQLIETDRCVSANKPACNLVFGKNRAAAYAVSIPLTLVSIWQAGKLKERGNGSVKALTLIGLNLILQTVLSNTANGRVLTCQPGRTPQCQ